MIQITPEAIVQQQALEAEQVDAAQSVPLENLKRIARDPKYTVYRDPSTLNYMGFFNTRGRRWTIHSSGVRSRTRCRTSEIIAVGAQGYATQARSAVPTGVFPYNPTTPQYQQDIAKARALLNQAGHKGGGFTLNSRTRPRTRRGAVRAH